LWWCIAADDAGLRANDGEQGQSTVSGCRVNVDWDGRLALEIEAGSPEYGVRSNALSQSSSGNVLCCANNPYSFASLLQVCEVTGFDRARHSASAICVRLGTLHQ
jgi:hypothetical protein